MFSRKSAGDFGGWRRHSVRNGGSYPEGSLSSVLGMEFCGSSFMRVLMRLGNHWWNQIDSGASHAPTWPLHNIRTPPFAHTVQLGRLFPRRRITSRSLSLSPSLSLPLSSVFSRIFDLSRHYKLKSVGVLVQAIRNNLDIIAGTSTSTTEELTCCILPFLYRLRTLFCYVVWLLTCCDWRNVRITSRFLSVCLQFSYSSS